MAYKSLLTVQTSPDLLGLDAAIGLARRLDAHLDILCLGVDRTQAGYYYGGATVMLQQEMIDRAREEAEAIEAAVAERMKGEEIRWSSESAVGQLGAIGAAVAMRARFSDLVVQAKPYGEGRGPEDEAIVEAALFEGEVPVLVVPDKGLGEHMGRRIVVAWNQSSEAMAAVRAAMPFLTTADSVNIAVIDPPQHGPERSDPGGPLSQMLARHGVRAEVSVLARTLPRISDILIRHISDIDADMVVMGAYGHSRLMQAILGGATRNMLEGAGVPVLMAH